MADLRTAVLALYAAIEPDRLRRLGLQSSLAFGRFVMLYRKYSESQPRDELGRWTDGDGGAGSEDDADGLTTGTIVTLRKDRTGDPLIDAHTDVFEAHMKLAMEIVGEGSGSSYGIDVHKVFADSVRSSNLPGVFINGIGRKASRFCVACLTASGLMLPFKMNPVTFLLSGI